MRVSTVTAPLITGGRLYFAVASIFVPGVGPAGLALVRATPQPWRVYDLSAAELGCQPPKLLSLYAGDSRVLYRRVARDLRFGTNCGPPPMTAKLAPTHDAKMIRAALHASLDVEPGWRLHVGAIYLNSIDEPPFGPGTLALAYILLIRNDLLSYRNSKALVEFDLLPPRYETGRWVVKRVGRDKMLCEDYLNRPLARDFGLAC